MLEKETPQLLAVLQRRTIGNSEHISVRDILAAEIPRPVKVFFRADIERILNDEQERARAGSRFNYAHPEVRSLQRQMNSVLVFNYSLSREQFLQKLDEGVHLLLNYSLRPQWTLSSFLFNTTASQSRAAIRIMLSHFWDYPYLREILLRYIIEKDIDVLTKEEFESILWRVDSGYVRRKSPRELAVLTQPIFSFIHFPHADSGRAIPTKALIKFFEDKRMRSVFDMLNHHMVELSATELTIEQLERLLTELVHTDPMAFEADRSFTKKLISFGTKSEKEEIESGGIQTRLPKRSGGQAVIESKEGAEPAPPPSTLPNLIDLITEEDRRRFLKKIFRRDEELLISSVAAIDAMTSFKEASIYIDEIFIANEVDPYSSDARRFTEIVYQRFFPASAHR